MAKSKSRKQQKAKAQKHRRAAATSHRVSTDEKVSRFRPTAYLDESLEDRAVFDDRAHAQLSPEIAPQVDQVRAALEHLEAGRDAAAEDCLKNISRRSPMSQWRLFIRGMSAWYAGDSEAAEKAFSRLDADRRPARIAETLAYAEQMKVDAQNQSCDPATENKKGDPRPKNEQPAGMDQSIFSGASIVHRIRHLRPAFTGIGRVINRKEQLDDIERPPEIPEDFPGPQQLQELAEFCKSSIRHEPALVAAVSENLLRLLCEVPLAEVLEVIARQLPGPPQDPQHFLLLALYYRKFQGAESEVESMRKKYLDSLPKNEWMSKPVASALTAKLHLLAAKDARDTGDLGPMAMFGIGPQADPREVKKHYLAATKAYPSYSEAHQEYVSWIEEELEQPRLQKTRQKSLEMDLAMAMASWAKGCPEEIEPRLWLVDHYLEEEKLELAEPHVRWLADSRNVDLRVRATQWKWQVLEAMRLSRRKTWLSGVKEQLDSAEKIWPAWLSKDWLPYLHAALALRSGDSDEYESIRKRIRQSWKPEDAEHMGLADAAMMLGAAQRMRVPAADLKPLRKPIDEAVKERTELSNIALLRAGHFFMELHRAGLVYPAYRMHGGKFADELSMRLNDGSFGKNVETKDEDFWPAMYWLAYQRTFAEQREVSVPSLLEYLNAPEKVAAIVVQTHLSGRRKWLSSDCAELLPKLKAAIPEEKDVYLKYWYTTLVEKASEIEGQYSDNIFGGGGSMLDRLMAMMHEEGDEDDDDDFDFY